MTSRKSYALAVCILLIAAVLRHVQLITLPAGFSDSEWTTLNIIDYSIRAGQISIFYQPYVSIAPQPGLYHTIVAVITLLIGDGILGYRLISVWAGMLTVALTYTLGVRLFGYLAGLAAMALLAVMMSAVLLSRVVIPQAVIPLLVTVVLMLLARAFPVYRRMRDETTSTMSFAALGFSLGLSLYTHSISTALLACCGLFTLYFLLMSHRRLLHHLSYVGFAVLMLFIVIVPYLLFIINRPENLAALNTFTTDINPLQSFADGIGGVLFTGDSNPAHNLPQRPLIDLISGIFVTIGMMVCIRDWRQSRFGLLLIALITLIPAALLTTGSPNFFAFAPILPLIALLFGTGVTTLLESTPSRKVKYIFAGGIALLFGFNLLWMAHDFFFIWGQQPPAQTAYNARSGQLAHYLDLTSGNIPTVLCDTGMQTAASIENPAQARMILRMMNRKNTDIRRVNCLRGLLFINGGAREQVILSEPDMRSRIHPYILEWIERGGVMYSNHLPPASVVILEARERLADTAGQFISLSPARFTGDAIAQETVMPPVRFGGNITWLGYDNYDSNRYKPGDVMTIITYWRSEGDVPPDLNFFFHILSDLVTVVRQRDTVAVNPRDLHDRDVFIQVTDIDLAQNMLPGQYTVSIGAYRTRSQQDERLPVYDSQQVNRGNRLLLYPVTIQE